jgi:protein SCO1/2
MRLHLCALIAALLAAVTPCRGQPAPGGPFALIDQDGVPRTDADFRGRYLLVYFGLTYCPDICPTELAAIAAALDQLGPEGERIQPLFVTIDPERDDAAQLKDYVALFHPRIIGLTGSAAQVRQAARAYRVSYAKYDIQGPRDYRMDHSGFVYFMAPGGGFITAFGQGSPPEALVQAIRQRFAADKRGF